MPANQDFIVNTDLTGVTSIDGSQISGQVNNSRPYDDKGLVVTTQDTGVDTPNVPNAGVTTKWQRYIWRRVPYTTDTDNDVRLYVWNPKADSDPIFLRWEELQINSPARQKVFFISTTGQDPNGHIQAIRPAIAYDANLNVWLKTNAENDDEGWVQLLGA